jgi:hypothetical protein
MLGFSSAAGFAAAHRSRPAFSRRVLSLMPTSLDNWRFSFHCPSSIAACFSTSQICASRAASNFQISCSAFFPR